MKQKLLISLCVIIFASITVSVQSQEKEKYSFKKFKTENTKKLKPGARMAIFLSSDSLQTHPTEKVVHGKLVSLNEKSLTVNCELEYEAKHYSIDSVKENYYNYSYAPQKSYDVSTIDYMTYEPKAKTAFEVITFISAVSTLILSPLLAYDMQTKDFSGGRYFSIVAPSLAVCAVSASLYFVFEKRKIKLLR